MVSRDDILSVLRTIDDPEMAISIVDLGLVERVQDADGHVTIDILPTFVGCHALPVIESEIRRKLAAIPGVSSVQVQICYSPPWNVDRITPAGRATLRKHGIAVPESADPTIETRESCPWCGSLDIRQESPFGPTRCRTIWYCEACHNPFERLKRVALGDLMELSLGRLRH